MSDCFLVFGFDTGFDTLWAHSLLSHIGPETLAGVEVTALRQSPKEINPPAKRKSGRQYVFSRFAANQRINSHASRR